jgi:hypothetical protein
MAEAAPAWTEIDAVPGDIFAVDAGRILYAQPDHTLVVKDRRTEATTPVTGLPGTPILGFLAPHGAVVQTDVANQTRDELYDWRNGALVDLGQVDHVKVAGAYAEWSLGQTLSMRDLELGTTTQISTSAGNTENDVAANGDVVFWDSSHSVNRYRGGATTLLAASTSTAWQTYPVTDGINVVWRETTPCCAADAGSLRGYGPSGAFTLADTARNSWPIPGADYQTSGGWIAFTRGEIGASTVWRRTPGGSESQLSTEPNSIVALNSNGDVIFAHNLAFHLSRPGSDPVAIPRPLPDTGAEIFSSADRWYARGVGSLVRLSVTNAPTDGSETHIATAPEGSVGSASAEFTFTSSVAGATFQCRLDSGPWESGCTTPKTYPLLADGRHSFLVRAVEPGGNVDPEPASQSWIVDTAAPVVTLTEPAADAATKDSTPAFGGAAGDADGDSDTVSVDIYAGTAATGTPVKTFDATRSGSTWSGSPATGLADGTYTAQARQADAAANVGLSGSRTFTVDTGQPGAFALSSPADGAQNLAPSPPFAWAPASDGGSGLDHYELSIDGAKDHDVQPSACNGSSCSTTPQSALPDGAHTWSITAVDRAGNTRSTAARSFTVDANPPASFGLVSPADGARTGDATPTLSWDAAQDAGSGVDHYDVFVDGNRVATGVGATSFTPASDLGEGGHEWRVEAVDGAGNARSSAQRGFVVDTTAPTAALGVTPNPVLTGDQVTLDASGSSDPGGGSIVRYEWDLDGDGTFERDTGATPTTTTSYATRGERSPAVRVSDEVGGTATASAPLSVRPAPPAGPVGVSINGGDQFTNDRDVTVDVVWPRFASALLISGDGGFRNAQFRAVDTQIAWTLDSIGSNRLPRTIYVRFAGGGDANQTFQDDIILDETAPQVTSARIVARGFAPGAARVAARARLRPYRLRISARDNISGVKKMQITTNRRKPGLTRNFRGTVTVSAASSKLWVRVRDGARNWSRWKRLAG